MSNEAETIIVRRQWNDFRLAKVLLSSVDGLHWDNISGGVGARSPHMMVYGFVYCDQIIEGELGHSCSHGPAPHRIKVVVVARDNPPALVKRLKAQCGPKP